MRPQTATLAATIRGGATAEEQLAALAGAYAGETAYVLSCGPSLTDVWSPALEGFLRDRLVIAVKQAYTMAPAAVDVHLFNRCRHQVYDYRDPATIRLAVELGAFAHEGDVRLPFSAPPEPKWLNSVLFSRALDEWALSNTVKRNWGPGLMLELGIFLPVHLGCRRVVFFGWDMSPVDPTHFHDLSFTPGQLQEHVVVSNALPQFIPHLSAWYARHGLEAFLCSPRSSVPLPQLAAGEVMADNEGVYAAASARAEGAHSGELRRQVEHLQRRLADRESECQSLREALAVAQAASQVTGAKSAGEPGTAGMSIAAVVASGTA